MRAPEGPPKSHGRGSRIVDVLGSTKGGFPMHLTTFILSSGIALTCIPACASAQSIPAGMWVPHCPKNEGDQVCARDAVPIVQESRQATSPAPRQRAYGSLWRPSRARQQR